MIAQALSTMAHYQLNPVVVLIDNGLYGYEQYLIERRYFEDSGTQPRPYVAPESPELYRHGSGHGPHLRLRRADAGRASQCVGRSQDLVEVPPMTSSRVTREQRDRAICRRGGLLTTFDGDQGRASRTC